MLSGSSDSKRHKLWMKLTGALCQMRENPRYYSVLLSEKGSQDNAHSVQIERDLRRTFPEDLMFSKNKLINSMRNVLRAYSWRNPNIGYCQGMNFILGTILAAGFYEEEAFWLLTQILETYLPVDYFSIMSGVLIDMKIFDYLISKKLPKLSMHIQEMGLDSSLFSVQWFICMFAYSLQRNVVITIWDHFIVEGSSVIFKVGLAILTLVQDRLLEVKEFRKVYVDDILSLIENFTTNLSQTDLLVNTAQEKYCKITASKLKKMRLKFKQQIESDLERNSQVFTSLNSSKIPLEKDVTSPCISEQECRRKSRRTGSFFTFRKGTINIIDNYLEDKCLPQYFNTVELRQTEKEIMLGQKNHVCNFEQTYPEDYETSDSDTPSCNTRETLLSSFMYSSIASPHRNIVPRSDDGSIKSLSVLLNL